MAHLKFRRVDKFSVPQHAFEKIHRIDIENLTLIKNVSNKGKLDAFER